MAQEFTPILENDISALTPDRTPAKVRAIDDLGQSVNLTPTQLAAMAGIDYSLLTEQVMPGCFFPDSNGVVKQVYGRRVTVSGTLGAASGGINDFSANVLNGVSAIIDIKGFVKLPTTGNWDGGTQVNLIIGVPNTVIDNEEFFTHVRLSDKTSPWGGAGTVRFAFGTKVSRWGDFSGRNVRSDAFIIYIKTT